MKRPVGKLNPDNLKCIGVHFDDNSSHYSVLYRAITELSKAGFASEEEIIEEWLNLLKSEKGEL